MRKVAGKCAKLRHFDIKTLTKRLQIPLPFFQTLRQGSVKEGVSIGGKNSQIDSITGPFQLPAMLDSITVTRNSSLISCVRRKLLSGYSIDRGSFYWRG